MFTEIISSTRKALKREKRNSKNCSCEDKILTEEKEIMSIQLGISHLPDRKVPFSSSSLQTENVAGLTHHEAQTTI